eukprot:TRINITY_DN7180_c0_g1_i1.p1 TRINITY_DN7180_c0_g1~~TRINITY_DN7180_c0_g1_i1.p1  ORF type:complete len:190 (+),score=40.58 TRINITY_DN7180_c0_g1_i1:52-621(+)
MVKTVKTSKLVELPDGVTATVQTRSITITGKRGSLTRDFSHVSADMALVANGRKIRLDMWFSSKKQMASVNTIASLIENMITGVTKGYRYKMRLVYAHFPININIPAEGNLVEIRNFLGEKQIRSVDMLGDVKITRSANVKDELVLEGNDVTQVSQSAANIWQSVRVRGKDIRKFLDGIYVSEKGLVDV